MNEVSGNVQIGRPEQIDDHIEAPQRVQSQNIILNNGEREPQAPISHVPVHQTTKTQEQFNISNASHPVACSFHLLFKSLAILAYILPFQMIMGQTSLFVIVVLMGCFDFWTVKNITGR